MNPSHSAKPIAESGEIWSPRAASPKVLELMTIINAMNARARPSIVRCAASFSSAIRRLPNGADRDEVQAAAARLAGERRRQAEDRPERGGEHEH